jgi:hypothetical protein
VALVRVDPVNTALVVACISGVVALASAGLSAWTQLQVTKRERQGRAEERRSDAKVVLDRYRGPLLDAAWQLGDRLDSIRHRGFLAYLAEGSGRERDAKLTALFRFAHYFGWREFVRTEVQLLRFENEEDTRSAAGFLDDVAEVLASDLLDAKWAMLWNDEQRGIGELMTERPSGASSIVRGHAAFYRDYDKTFAPWMERFAGDLLSPAALTSDRLRLLQWALYGLVRQLDEEGTYGGVWIDRSASEIRQPAQHGSFTQHEEQLRRHLAAIEPSTSSLPCRNGSASGQCRQSKSVDCVGRLGLVQRRRPAGEQVEGVVGWRAWLGGVHGHPPACAGGQFHSRSSGRRRRRRGDGSA